MIMSTAATSIPFVNASPPNAHPTNTAITGLIKVCVEIRVALVTVRSHVYAENVIIEPNMTRYANPNHDWTATCEKVKADHSPLKELATINKNPPNKSCKPPVIKGERGSFATRA